MIQSFMGKAPEVAASAFIAETAVLVGDVTVGERSSVWFHTVVRGDIHFIRIGQRTNIQDLSVLHVRRGIGPVILGDDITVGHRAVLHACTVGNCTLVGIGAIVLDGAVVGEQCIVAAGALVTPGSAIPPGSFVMGMPARVKRNVTPGEVDWIRESAERYVGYARDYLENKR